MKAPIVLGILLLSHNGSGAFGLATLLRDLPTPCLLLDVGLLAKKCGSSSVRSSNRNDCNANANDVSADTAFLLPPLRITNDGIPAEHERDEESFLFLPRFLPKMEQTRNYYTIAQDSASSKPLSAAILTQTGVCYLHSSVMQNDNDDDMSVPIDLATTEAPLRLPDDFLQRPPPAHLVLGLNNHHVGSYYWARSSGTGSSMEAPGVQLGWDNDTVDYAATSETTTTTTASFLEWQSAQGFTDCNSNDGKRSEWVPFLRQGDTIQLIPSTRDCADSTTNDKDEERHPCMEWFRVAAVHNSWPIYGVSSRGRPLGSEPEVVCQWVKDIVQEEHGKAID